MKLSRLACALNQLFAFVQPMQPSSDTIKGLMPFSNDTAMLEDDATFDQSEDDWFPIGENSFDDDFDDGLDDNLEDDCGDNNDILNCNHVKGGTKHA
ncbi:Uncharacterized protein TCM_041310 [Theobroma cacao]|uniref:Uncharacterized protein n=1 Tax=Theobroma cacao TaxID=3641 RepID=A0A061GZN5_THECC|nr:Uncharacterized protein TCM_041310 [Theobroma cacao]